MGWFSWISKSWEKLFHACERISSILKKRQHISHLLVYTVEEEDMVISNVLSQETFYCPFGYIIENV